MYGYCVIGRELRRAKVVQYNRRYIESFLCRDFINSYADKERRYKIGLLDLSGIISFYFNKEISYLVVFCKYISKKGNEFYCFIPTYIYLNYLCDLAVLQSSDLAFAADAKFIDKYCKLSGFLDQSLSSMLMSLCFLRLLQKLDPKKPAGRCQRSLCRFFRC